MELHYLWVLGLYLFYVQFLALLAHEATLPPELGFWGASRIPVDFWLPELMGPTAS